MAKYFFGETIYLMPDSKKKTAGKLEHSCDDILREYLGSHLGKISQIENGVGLYPMVLELVEKSLFKLALEETNGNQSQAALILGLNRNTLRRKLGDYKIKVKKK